MNRIIIDIKDLTKLYPSGKGIRDINISIGENSINMIEGNNGSGKTTLLKTIAGILKPDNGIVKCFNEDITNNYKRIMEYISILTDIRSIYWRLTLKENIEFISGLQGIDSKQSFNYIYKYIEMFDMIDYINEQVRFLSEGNKEKAAIICTLARMTPIILFDEPTVNLDKDSINTLKDIIRDLSSNRTIVLSSHNDILKNIADKIIYIKNGTIEEII